MSEQLQLKKSKLPATPKPKKVEPEYTDEQFQADIEKASPKLEALAAKARKAIAEGTARKFPA